MNIDFSRSCEYKSIYLHLEECKMDFFPPLNERVELSDFAQKISNNAVVFCAKDNLKIVGLVSCYYNNGIYGFINHVSVVTEYKGLGIAKKLMKMCIDYASDNNYSTLRLEVNSDNTAAITLYSRFGFVIKGVKDDYIEMNRVVNLEGKK